MADETDKDQYDDIASKYDTIETLPHSFLSQDLVLQSLGDCTGKVILDLGGGSGLHARNAISKGALRVDNVDISPEMLQNCRLKEERAGRKPGERVACYTGDATQPLDHLKLPGRDVSSGLYDIVMVIWTFDHATTTEELEGVWRNVSQYCAPGGKLISIRTADPNVPRAGGGKYGVVVSEIEPRPGGARYKFTIGLDEATKVSAMATNMEANWDFNQAREMAKRFGFEDLEAVPTAEMPIVKKNPEFWKEFLEAPDFRCVIGNKA